MGADHEPFSSLGPVEWQQIPQDGLEDLFNDTFAEVQTVVESIPSPASNASASASTSTGRARSKTESAVSPGDIMRAHSQRQKAASMSQSQDLRKEWKEAKVNAKDNPLGINVYKLSAKDGRGSWFARRSVHEGLSFDSWKKGLEIEFAETMKVQGAPGSGNIRGIGADKRVEDMAVGENNHLQVFQLSAQFPGPTAPRDFITLLLTSESSVKPADGCRPLRQFMVVSKPCEHPDCPPRQGIIRGYYESVEVIREIPADPSTKRSLSSTDLSRDENRRTGHLPGSDENGPSADDFPIAIEWLMVTRSDPGGSVPRFLIEKGTPPGIVGDAGKFLKWLTAKANKGFPKADDVEETKNAEVPIVDKNKSPIIPNAPTTNVDAREPQTSQQDDTVTNSNGLYGIIAGALGSVSSYVAPNLYKHWQSYSDPGTMTDGSVSDSQLANERREEDESDTSSIRSFTSALEQSVTEEKSPGSIAESISEGSRSLHANNLNDKELKKLEEKRRKLDEKVAKLNERRQNKLENEKGKDTSTVSKLREKHDREIAKQEEKYRREVRKLEEKREAERKKTEERRRKAAEREEKNNLTLELERVRAERNVAQRQIEILETQVGELQAQNTLLVRKMGDAGLLDKPEPSPSIRGLSKSPTAPPMASASS